MKRKSLITILLLTLGSALSPRADHLDPDPHQGQRYETMSKATSNGGVVASLSQQASDVGVAVLDAGGNAMDAAVAMVFAVGVTRPDEGGIGGGGFLLYRSNNNEVAALDFRETAPDAVRPWTFQGSGMHKDSATSLLGELGSGHLPVGVPGTVAGMAAALDRYGSGKFTLAQLIAPAEKLARTGVRVTYELGFFAFFNRDRLSYYPETAAIYGAIEAQYFSKEPLIQEDYARSLRLIMHNGPAAFYQHGLFRDPLDPPGVLRPSIADLISEDMARRPTGNEYWTPTSPAFNPTLVAKFGTGGNDRGLMTRADLANYQPIWRQPLTTNFGDYQVYALPPPTSGMTVIEILNLLKGYPLGSDRHFLTGICPDVPVSELKQRDFRQSQVDYLHVLAEAQKLAFADRAKYLADPAFVQVPVEFLTSEDYGNQRRGKICLDKAKAYDEVEPGSHTNHISVIDKDGNAVAVTTTINSPFGSVVVAPGAGFLLNDELRDFNMGYLVCDGGVRQDQSCKEDLECPAARCSNDLKRPGPGTANEAFGGKRPRSSAIPTIVVKNGKPVLVIGGAGGPTIIMGVVQPIINVTVFGRSLFHAIDDERVDTLTWAGFPTGNLVFENRVTPAVEAELQARGHTTSRQGEYNGLPNVMATGIDLATGLKHAVADPRQQRNFEGNDEEKGAAGQTRVADLEVSSIVTTNNKSPQGGKVTITATILNTGFSSAGASQTEFLLDGTTVLGLVDTPAVPAGGMATVSVQWPTAGVKGEHTVRVTADKTDLVAESDEGNNAAARTVTVKGNKTGP